jgi:hypothetical protein
VAAHATIHAAAAQACSRRPPRVAGSPTRGWRRAGRLLLPPHQSAHRLLRVRAPLARPSPPMEVEHRCRVRAVFCESGRLQRGLLFRWRSSAAVEGAPSSVSLGASSTCRRRESAVSLWCTRLELSQGPRLHPLQAGHLCGFSPAASNHTAELFANWQIRGRRMGNERITSATSLTFFRSPPNFCRVWTDTSTT